MLRLDDSRWILAIGVGVCLAAVQCGDDPAAPADGGGGRRALTFTNFQDAAVVIGQPNKTSGAEDAGGTTGPIGLSAPFNAGSGALYVADRGNHRVLGFNGIPTSDGPAATFVLGQPNFTSCAPGVTAKNFNTPSDCLVWGGKLFVVDYGNHRVLIWNALPTGDVPADVVVGQTDFTSSASAVTQSNLVSPLAVVVAGGRVFVADNEANRVLIWNSIPTTNGEPADVVVGQPNFTSGATGLSASSFGFPNCVWTDGTRLAIGDGLNRRVLIWNTIPASSGEAADVVVGAADFTTAGSSTASATSIGTVGGVASDGTSLFVADQGFHRVLVYRPFPTSNGAAASVVLGQTDFSKKAPNDANQDGVEDASPTARTLRLPRGLRVIGDCLLVAEWGNNRISIFEGN